MIVGPTASGKTKLSVELAKLLNGEIISADSMQIYKYMDIGTAKVTKEEMEGIKHYLIDEVFPDEEFSVARFQELALKYIEEILQKGKTPIIVGGTGLYVNSLVYNINFSESQGDWGYRDKLTKEAEEKGIEVLFERLKEVDPETADKLHLNDTKRIIRALEVYEQTGKPMSYHVKESRKIPPKYDFRIIGLSWDRALLYDRINKRVDKMIEDGLLDEVKSLVEKGYDNNTIAMQAIGYKEILAHLRGEMTLDEAIELIKLGSRRYAKRQITWFKRLENLQWVALEEEDNVTRILQKSIKVLQPLE